MSRIDVFRPTVGHAELMSVEQTFRSGWLGSGPKVQAFERAWSEHLGVDAEHVVAVNSATEALFLLCEWTIADEDEVIIPSIHFIGADNAIRAQDAIPVYCDVDPHTLNPTLDCIVQAYTDKTTAVMLLHYGGCTQELDDIRAWCDERRLRLIEDAACAQATRYKGRAAGTWGEFGVWSFDAMKVITCGDGGMIYAESETVANVLRRLRYLGTNSASGLSSTASDRWWEYTADEPSRRSIMNDVAASIGLEQLKQLYAFVGRRRAIVKRYDEALAGLVTLPPNLDVESYPDNTGYHPYYFYWIQTERRDELARYLRSVGIYTTFRYYPLHRAHKLTLSLPGADYAADHTLLLPLHQGLSDDDVTRVITAVRLFFGRT